MWLEGENVGRSELLKVKKELQYPDNNNLYMRSFYFFEMIMN